jgi:DNA polymerase-3 subunit chi
MTEMLFYHLARQPLERVLPTLLERSIARSWRVVVQAPSEERVDALDAHLWTFRDESFLPHGTWRDAEAAEQPILLTIHDDNPNGAAVRFLIDGAPVPADARAYERIVVLFDGEDPEAVVEARASWSAGKAQGFAVTYWQTDAQGRWQQMA